MTISLFSSTKKGVLFEHTLILAFDLKTEKFFLTVASY